MANRSKNIGTSAETAVVRFARENGFPKAERLALAGSADQGDIRLAPGLVVEVKAHKAFSDAQVMLWLGEAEAERINARAEHAFLVVKRPGKGAAQVSHWWAVELEHNTGAPRPTYRYLGDYLALMVAEGWAER